MLTVAAAFLLIAAGCQSTAPTPRPQVAPVNTAPTLSPTKQIEQIEQVDGIGREGFSFVFHVVERGQTLWRIAKSYELTVEELAKANGISDATRIEVGQRLVIPGVGSARPICSDPICTVENSASSLEKSVVDPSPASEGGEWSWPVLGGRISSLFGAKRGRSSHHGVDILVPRGSAIHASREGIVRFAGKRRGYGLLIVIDHADGFSSYYAHNSRNRVRTGASVRSGQVIGLSGASGNATAPHVHFELRQNGKPLDPLQFLTRD